jgi:hypothetical protein
MVSNERQAFEGGCHCGALQLSMATSLAPHAIVPRACDCSFCQKHGAAYVSDPDGRLALAVGAADALRRYRQGSGSAEFLLCGACGVLVAVVYAAAGRLFGAVNARCVDQASAFAGPVPASPQTLAPDVKRSRWSALWFPDVALTIQGSGNPAH